MLLEPNLTEHEAEKTAIWELFADLIDFDFTFQFTAKELAKEINYKKSDLNKYLFRLYTNKALLLRGTAPNGASIYSLNPEFLR